MQMAIKSFFILRSVVGRAEHHGADAMQPPTTRNRTLPALPTPSNQQNPTGH
jgi:hypothetical protein